MLENPKQMDGQQTPANDTSYETRNLNLKRKITFNNFE